MSTMASNMAGVMAQTEAEEALVQAKKDIAQQTRAAHHGVTYDGVVGDARRKLVADFKEQQAYREQLRKGKGLPSSSMEFVAADSLSKSDGKEAKYVYKRTHLYSATTSKLLQSVMYGMFACFTITSGVCAYVGFHKERILLVAVLPSIAASYLCFRKIEDLWDEQAYAITAKTIRERRVGVADSYNTPQQSKERSDTMWNEAERRKREDQADKLQRAA